MHYDKDKFDLLSKLYAMEKSQEKFETPEDAVIKLLPYRDKKTEHFVVLAMDNKNHFIAKKVFKGTADQTAVYPREVFRFALQKQATGIIMGHNHPGGDPAPSRNDREIIKSMQPAANILGVRVLDNIIVARSGHYSFKEHGLI